MSSLEDDARGDVSDAALDGVVVDARLEDRCRVHFPFGVDEEAHHDPPTRPLRPSV